jgi:hypothetical protein
VGICVISSVVRGGGYKELVQNQTDIAIVLKWADQLTGEIKEFGREVIWCTIAPASLSERNMWLSANGWTSHGASDKYEEMQVLHNMLVGNLTAM